MGRIKMEDNQLRIYDRNRISLYWFRELIEKFYLKWNLPIIQWNIQLL